MHGIPAGSILYEDAISWTPFQSLEHARSAGEMLARLHCAAENFGALVPQAASACRQLHDLRIAKCRRRPGAISRRPPRAGSTTRTLARTAPLALDLLAPFHDELKPLLPALSPLWTHNDLHASNLFWSDRSPHAHATSVIDFGLADRTNAVYDLAQAIERNIVEWLVLMQDPNAGDEVPVHLDHLWAMLDGYELYASSAAQKQPHWPRCCAICHAEFALTEADYFLGVLHSPEKARVATRDYLVGHAQWFRGPGRERSRAFAAMGRNASDPGGARMILSAIAHYLIANWVELAGFVTTAVGIWLTTQTHCCICWPVVLAPTFLPVVFYHARLCSDTLLQVFFFAFTLYGWWHWWRGIREEGEVRVVPLALDRVLLIALARGAAGSCCLG